MLTNSNGRKRTGKPIAVIALGGNAICASEDGSQEVDELALKKTAESLLAMLRLFESLVVTYGNGPQVGNDFLRSELSRNEVSPLELYQCTANTQGRIGSALELAIRNASRGTHTEVYCVLSHVIVSEDSYVHLTKPIGPFYDKSQALEIDQCSQLIKEVAPGKFRRIVGSPMPVSIVEQEEIEGLLGPGKVILACGGGGVPVAYRGNELVPVQAVIDKDLTSSLLAQNLNADMFLIATKTDGVALGFNASPRYISKLTVDEALYHLHNGEFPSGSMGPKVSACISYVWNTGKEAVITSLDKMVDAALGKAGTRFINHEAFALSAK
ncbi:carbamate kinase [Candidatus Woesearchaeota archaeon]|nr:carbamate kinase [Candidatus Woesearchaeota archaeon]